MRARYSAHAVGDVVYLQESWDPATRPRSIDLDPAVVWVGLEVVDTEAGGPDDDHGIVEFRAHHRRGGIDGTLHERSRFTRVNRRWAYLDGHRPPG
jgi:SEC-C motif-containing protein